MSDPDWRFELKTAEAMLEKDARNCKPSSQWLCFRSFFHFKSFLIRPCMELSPIHHLLGTSITRPTGLLYPQATYTDYRI